MGPVRPFSVSCGARLVAWVIQNQPVIHTQKNLWHIKEDGKITSLSNILKFKICTLAKIPLKGCIDTLNGFTISM